MSSIRSIKPDLPYESVKLHGDIKIDGYAALDEWRMDDSMQDGHFYMLRRYPKDGAVSLLCTPAIGTDVAGLFRPEDGVGQVERSAFSDWEELKAFAEQVGELLECCPSIIITSVG